MREKETKKNKRKKKKMGKEGILILPPSLLEITY
jgi:hypothetical protein